MISTIGGELASTDVISTIGGEFASTDVISTIGGEFASTYVVSTIGSEFAGTYVIGAISCETCRTYVISTISSEFASTYMISTISGESSRAGECSRTGAIVAISSESVGGQYREGQGENQTGFHGGVSREVGVVCLVKVHTTPIISIKKRK
ncbi:hypothetical protein [Pseudomonas vancouverensis]|uniref:hypothetical protein n=1 Tax=Pseudomonas vancouverensis TaxID=95300 RepID=UPI0012FDE0FE